MDNANRGGQVGLPNVERIPLGPTTAAVMTLRPGHLFTEAKTNRWILSQTSDSPIQKVN